MPGTSDDGPRRLSRGLGSVARRLGSPPPVVLATVFNRWPEVVGPGLATRCRPLAVREGALMVAVEELGWATEVRFLAPGILARAAELAGQPVAERLEVRVRPSR
ncbi:MAG: DciA family protein [Acidimicrobiales bacterium]